MIGLNKNLESGTIKSNLDYDLLSLFNDGYKMAIIKNFDDLPAEAASLFYYYDSFNEHHEFKDAAIFLTMIVDNREFNNLTEVENHVIQCLSGKWFHVFHEDQIEPMFTRISNNLIYLP